MSAMGIGRRIGMMSHTKKYYVFYSETKNDVCVTYIVFDKRFHTFGYFKNGDDAYKAIELFGDEIKALFVDCEA